MCEREKMHNKMKLAYVAGPYRAPTAAQRQDNIHRARKAAESLWRAGYAVLCPHMNSANMDGIVDDEVFLQGCLEMVRRCDLVWLLPGWRASEGAVREVAEAERCGVEVRFPTIAEESKSDI